MMSVVRGVPVVAAALGRARSESRIAEQVGRASLASPRPTHVLVLYVYAAPWMDILVVQPHPPQF